MIDKDNVMKIEYTVKIAGVHDLEKIALYNKNRITQKEVKNLIDNGEYSPHVIIIDRQQFDNVFFK